MTEQTPPDWVLIEAAKLSGFEDDPEALFVIYRYNNMFRALCDMIWKYEQPPVDRKLLCAEEAATGYGYEPDDMAVQACVRSIELWEEGFGSD